MKSTRKTKLFYFSSRSNNVRPLSRRRRPRSLTRIGQFPPYDISPSIANRKSKNMYSIPSAHKLNSRPPCTLSGRAGNACTNLLGFFVYYVRTRGIAEISESGKTTDFRSVLCRTHLPRTARATNSCTPHGGFQGGRRESSLMTFAALLVTQKREKRKVSL